MADKRGYAVLAFGTKWPASSCRTDTAELLGLTICHVQDDSSGHIWREEVAKRVPLAHDAQVLGRLIEYDRDPSEVAYYEAFADPDAQAVDDAQRSYAGQYRRKLRRLDERRKHARSDREA